MNHSDRRDHLVSHVQSKCLMEYSEPMTVRATALELAKIESRRARKGWEDTLVNWATYVACGDLPAVLQRYYALRRSPHAIPERLHDIELVMQALSVDAELSATIVRREGARVSIELSLQCPLSDDHLAAMASCHLGEWVSARGVELRVVTWDQGDWQTLYAGERESVDICGHYYSVTVQVPHGRNLLAECEDRSGLVAQVEVQS
jgi:hypothetical protein